MTAIDEAILSPWIAAAVLAAFSVLWVFLGWLWGRKNKDLDDYMLAGRKVGLALGTATAMATWVTSNTTMVAPQLAYQMGIWGMVGYSLGSVGLLLFAPMASRIRRLMPSGYTSGDFIRLRYGKLPWRIFLGISIFYSFGWLISLGMAGGILINALSGIPYWVGMTVILTICVAYTLMGGLRAVIGTDFIQTIIIVIGVVALGYLTLQRVGFEEVHQQLQFRRPELLNLLMPAAIMFLFNNLLFGMGEIFHSNVWWSRAFAFGKGVGFKAYLLAGLFWTPIPIAAGFAALAAPALDLNVPQADMVAPLIAARLMGSLGAVLVFVVVFSALASSLDSLLAATSDLITEDIYHKHIHPQADKPTLRKAAWAITLLLGVGTWVVCLFRLTTLGSLLHFTGAFVASTIGPIVLGLYWRKTNPAAAGWAMLLGSLSGFAAYFQIGFYVAALIGAAVSMSVVVAGSLAKPSDFRWRDLQEEEPSEERQAEAA
ncbi:MAG TPA: sodium:solute symporter family protein [Acidobacteriota bacterium]|nr:sodium:solute symporter family protein [Acidobacteriota bacterium]